VALVQLNRRPLLVCSVRGGVEHADPTGVQACIFRPLMTDPELTPGNEYEGFIEKMAPNRLMTVLLDSGQLIQARITPRIGMLPGNLEGRRVRVLMRRPPKPATVRHVFPVET
jgi:hypothetical protein